MKIKLQLPLYKDNFRRAQIYFVKHLWEYCKLHLVDFEILLLIYFFLQIYIYIPYINLFVKPWFIYMICIVAGKYLLKISAKSMLIGVMILFFYTCIRSIMGDAVGAETFGNVIYFLLWYIGISAIFEIKHYE